MKQILKYVIYILCFLLGILISFNLKENFSLGNEIYISNRLFLKDICKPAPAPLSELPECPKYDNCFINKVNSSSIKDKLINGEGFNISRLFSDDILNNNSVVFDASMSSEVINNIARQVFFIVGENKHSAEFSDKRVGLFFKPGIYGTGEQPIRIKVNYYTGVYGLGKTPEEVVINGTIQVCNVDSYDNLTSSCNWLGPYNALHTGDGIPDNKTYLGAKCPLNPNKPDKLYLDDGILHDGNNMIGKTPVKNLCHDNYDGALDNFWRGLENLTLNVNNINKHLQFSNASGNYTVSDQSDWPEFSDLGSVQDLDYDDYNPSTYSLSDNSLQSPNLIWDKNNKDFSRYNSWAASQACAVRRLNCSGIFLLSETQGHSSGGFISDSIFNNQDKLEEALQYGTQQQYLTRNCDIQTGGGINGGAWNLVFVGSKINKWSDSYYNPASVSTVIDNTEVIAQKPYIYFDNQNYYLAVPSEKKKCSGVTDYNDLNASYILSGDNVIIIKTNIDFNSINDDFNTKDTKIIIITPNVYNLEKSIVIEGNFIILGIGMPTIRAPLDKPAIVAKKINGGRLAGILIEASLGVKDCLVDWGNITENDTDTTNSYIHDLYCRVGGNLNASNCCVRVTDSMLKISKSHTIIDNAWLWVADHGNDMPASSKCSSDLTDSDIPWKTIWYNAYCPTCLHVTNSASKVTAYCLQAEHSTGGNIVNWYGDNGSIYMFQSEFPYHPIDEVLTTIESDEEYYTNNVYYDYNAINVVDKSGIQGKHLSVYGGGAYSYFVCDKNGSGIIIDNSFNLGDYPGNYNLFSRYLDGSRKSGIKNTINNGIDACKPNIYGDGTHLISSFIEGDSDKGDYHKNQPSRELNIDGEMVYYKWCKNGLKRVDKNTTNNSYLIIDTTE